MGRLLSLKEVQQTLGVGKHVVLGLIRRGELPAGKVGNRWRVREEDLNAYIERTIGRSEPVQPPIKDQLRLPI